MKKSLFIAAAVLALSSGLAACELNAGESNDPIGGAELTAEKWASAMTDAALSKSFTVTTSAEKFSATLKCVPEQEKYYYCTETAFEGSASGDSIHESIIAKDGEKYVQYARSYSYAKEELDSLTVQKWNKSEISETSFGEMTSTYQNDFALALIGDMKDKFRSFVYNESDQVYRAATFTFNLGTADSVIAKFENNRLISVTAENLKSSNGSAATYIYSDFNTTAVALPDADSIQEELPSLAGKTFVFESLTIDGAPNETFHQFYVGSTMVFADDRNVTVTYTDNGVDRAQQGTYAIKGSIIVISFGGDDISATYQSETLVCTVNSSGDSDEITVLVYTER